MNFESLISGLKARLVQPLPGKEVQYRMAPLGRKTISDNFDVSKARDSAVLILLYPENSKIYLPLTQRNEYDGIHSAQISLPGGKTERSDRDFEHTALRESQEELGIDPEHVQVIGKLSELFIPVSNFRVIPILGINDQKPEFKPDPKEVQKLLEVDIESLLDLTLRKSTFMKFKSGMGTDVPYFDLQGHIVWGATAMILSEFSQVLSEIQGS